MHTYIYIHEIITYTNMQIEQVIFMCLGTYVTTIQEKGTMDLRARKGMEGIGGWK